MRVVAAFVLLASILTTHASALERASMKAIDAPYQASMTVAGEVTGAPLASAPDAEMASGFAKGPCLKNGDCTYLLSMHRFNALSPPAVLAARPAHRPVDYHGEGVERPPNS